ncbi:MAG TPA: exodeoxyribonuclease VII large subunit, partial [Clostridiaceae bacterium]|nr:exodeoxyribonuclease VII large subunit [Clostridiaceae bacterium]
ELVIPEKRVIIDRLENYKKRLAGSLARKLTKERERMDKMAKSRCFRRPLDFINQKRQAIDSLDRNLALHGRALTERFRSQFRVAAGRLNALSPLTVLSRGYSVVRKEDGTIVRSVSGLEPGDRLIVKVADGEFAALHEKTISSMG